MASGWTNGVLRKHLGERGFNEVRTEADKDGTVSTWQRHAERLIMVEYKSGDEPVLYYNGIAIDPKQIGWMNVNTQEQAYREQSAEAARIKGT